VQHQRRVEREFARQAESFAASATLAAAELTERLAAALGETRLGRILDAACGPGLLSTALSPRAQQVVSVDLTSEMLRVARRRRDDAGLGNVLFARSLVEQLPFAPACFDAAVLRLALHHFDRPDTALRSLRAVLRPGARLALLDLLGCEDPETARLHDAIERLRDPSHQALVPETRLRELVCGAGFRVERCETWSRPREVREWTGIVADAKRSDALEVVLRQLCRAGVSAGVDLREVDGALWMTYRWCLLVAVAADGEA
jgi:ubiquinone/menaquinone biosynthesis C-methylase UbiE